jgi:hypothetical protein
MRNIFKLVDGSQAIIGFPFLRNMFLTGFSTK